MLCGMGWGGTASCGNQQTQELSSYGLKETHTVGSMASHMWVVGRKKSGLTLWAQGVIQSVKLWTQYVLLFVCVMWSVSVCWHSNLMVEGLRYSKRWLIGPIVCWHSNPMVDGWGILSRWIIGPEYIGIPTWWLRAWDIPSRWKIGPIVCCLWYTLAELY